jgi:predicted nicotinamide N-methyase
LINWDGIDYKGIDVSDVVLTNTKKYSRAGVKFLELDAVRDDIPSADLVIIKDVMQHWSNDDIIKFLPRLNRFGAALITNGFHQNVMHLLNKDITTGEYRAINLSNSPFNINGHFVYWFTADEPKSIFLWKKS